MIETTGAAQFFVKIGEQLHEVSAMALGPFTEPVLKTPLYKAIGAYIKERTSKKSKATRTNEKTYFSNLYEYLACQSVLFCDEVKASHINEYKAHLLTKVSPSTVNRQFNTIKNFFAVQTRKRIVIYNPCSEIIQETIEKKIRTPWTEDDLYTVAAYTDYATALILEFIWLTGARNIEAVNLLWTDIYQDENYLLLRSYKGSKGTKFRKLPIDDVLSKFLHSIPTTGIHVFGNGSKFTSDSLGKKVRKAVKASGIKKDLTVYGIRHSFCKGLLQARKSKPVVQVLMGHKSYKTTEEYVHWDNDFLKDELSSIR